jgi:uncharacterized protein
MKMITRQIKEIIQEKLFQKKAIIVFGPRQTGKTTLLKEILSQSSEKSIILNCDDPITREMLINPSLVTLRQIVGDKKIVFVDEAQRVVSVGLTLKLIQDNIDTQLLVSGSSSFEIANNINEPLTGRKWEFQLFPISWKELSDHEGYINSMSQLETRLIYGMYPDVINHLGNEKETLQELANSFLYKDLLQFEGVRKPELLNKILKAIAFQVGSEVSLNEVANLVQTDKNTVSKYIDLLEKVFIIFRLPSLRRNMRNEIGTKKKIYFYDNGIRNALIGNFNPLEFRTDVGALWENFLVSERIKKNSYQRNFCSSYFWRTIQQQEIDYVEEVNGKLFAFEFKWNQVHKVKVPKQFIENYPDTVFNIISKENFHEFLTEL